MASRRLALVINACAGNHFPAHPTSLNAIEHLKEVLSSAGQFQIAAVSEADIQTTKSAISRLFDAREADDVLLLYFIGNIIFTENNQLWFALPTTDLSSIETTSISSEFVLAEIKASPACNIVLVLDTEIGVEPDSSGLETFDQQLQAEGKSLAILARWADPHSPFPNRSATAQAGYSLTEAIGLSLLELPGNWNEITVAGLSSHLRSRPGDSPLLTRMDDSTGQIIFAPAAPDTSLQVRQERLKPNERELEAAIDALPAETSFPPDENVQFTVYRPASLAAGRWQRMLVFTHIEEDSDQSQDQKPPAQEVVERAQRILAEEFENYRPLAADSQFPIPRESEITLIPDVPKVTFNPPRRSFIWAADLRVHDESFLLKAPKELAGSLARGRVSIFLGHILLADIAITFRVEPAGTNPAAAEQRWTEASARPFRKVFASYSHRDAQIVEAMEQHVRALGYDYLRDVVHLRSGQSWDDRLLGMIKEADIFQLFWSSNSACSGHVEREWRYALALAREAFVRPAFWEIPMPAPPEPLRNLHFYRLPALVPVIGPSSSARAGDTPSENPIPEESNSRPLPAAPLARSEPAPSEPGQLPAAQASPRQQRKRFGFWSAMLGGTAAACLVVFASFYGGMIWFSTGTQTQNRESSTAAATPLATAMPATETTPPALVGATSTPAASPALAPTATPKLASPTPRRTKE
ncbi:MAG TPA: TIR domain-containing protein [Chthoniobacterales bacterium]|nr:TIR domain-containing protein [Chthoniobacterales bacterium]